MRRSRRRGDREHQQVDLVLLGGHRSRRSEGAEQRRRDHPDPAGGPHLAPARRHGQDHRGRADQQCVDPYRGRPQPRRRVDALDHEVLLDRPRRRLDDVGDGNRPHADQHANTIPTVPRPRGVSRCAGGVKAWSGGGAGAVSAVISAPMRHTLRPARLPWTTCDEIPRFPALRLVRCPQRVARRTWRGCAANGLTCSSSAAASPASVPRSTPPRVGSRWPWLRRATWPPAPPAGRAS